MPLGQKKLGKVITPDPWKKGARNTTGKKTLWMKIIWGSAEFRGFTFFGRSMKFCVTATVHLRDHPDFVGRYSLGNRTSNESEVTK